MVWRTEPWIVKAETDHWPCQCKGIQHDRYKKFSFESKVKADAFVDRMKEEEPSWTCHVTLHSVFGGR